MANLGERSKMTEELFESGIHTENSDIRAHVSVVNRKVYVFQTKHGVDALNNAPGRIVPAHQDGVEGPTAKGKLVPWEEIKGIRMLRFNAWPRWGEFSKKMSTSQRGNLAVACVIDLMKIGRFPLWLDAVEDQRENIQIKGTDIMVFCRKKIQVKCDWECGEKPPGSGNIFLQIAERNPLKRY